MTLIEKLVKNIDERRLGMNLSVDNLARKAEIPYSTLHNIRQKKVKDISLKTTLAIARALNCTVEELIE